MPDVVFSTTETKVVFTDTAGEVSFTATQPSVVFTAAVIGLPGDGVPDAHAASHADGGADEVALAASQITSGQFTVARVASGTATDGFVPTVASGELVLSAPSAGGTTLHADLTDTDTDGHPASVIATTVTGAGFGDVTQQAEMNQTVADSIIDVMAVASRLEVFRSDFYISADIADFGGSITAGVMTIAAFAGGFATGTKVMFDHVNQGADRGIWIAQDDPGNPGMTDGTFLFAATGQPYVAGNEGLPASFGIDPFTTQYEAGFIRFVSGTDWVFASVDYYVPATSGDWAGITPISFAAALDRIAAVDGEINGTNGDVVGPASSVDGAVALFDGTTGKLVKDSGVTLGTAATTAATAYATAAQGATADAALAASTAPELIRDTIGTALVAGSGVTITPNDGADTITVAGTVPDWANWAFRTADNPFVRSSFSAYGGPDVAGAAPATNTTLTIFDSADSTKGGVTSDTNPGWISRISLYISGSTTDWSGYYRVQIFYDGETVPTIDGPLTCLFGCNGSSSYRLDDMAAHQNKGTPANGSQYHLTLPIPYRTSIKVQLITPNAGASSSPGLWTGVDSYKGAHPAFGAGTGQRKLRNQWYSPYTNTNVVPNIATADFLSVAENAAGNCGPGAMLSAAVNSSVTSVALDSAANLTRAFPVGVKDPLSGTVITNATTAMAPNLYAYIGNECVQITAISMNTLTVVRGVTDPVSGAATTAAAHAQYDFCTRVLGPGRVHGWIFGGGQNSTSPGWCEGPAWVNLAKDVNYQVAALHSGGVEDLFGNGYYGGQAAMTGYGHSQPSMGVINNQGGNWRVFYRFFNRDPFWFARGFGNGFWNRKSPLGDTAQGVAPGTSNCEMSTWFYTEN